MAQEKLQETGSDEVTNDEAEAAESAPARKGKRKLLIIAAALVVVLLGAGLFFSGVLGGGAEKTEELTAADAKDTKPAAAAPVYYELPQFLVNLNSATGRVSFLKMSVTLELRDTAAVGVMDANKPRIVDTFNTYLRELRPADIQGSEGIYRLRTELMSRLNGTLEEGLVKDVLFGEIIVQ